jgi:alkanesulfonate monooxygenase SsuD/methylene tetrahydromethanopterin reductase-like flavin-dependent oxidoreductase (luciferase family)
MQVWLFDIMMWPHGGERTRYPYPGRLYDCALGQEFYQEHLRYYVRADELGYDGVCFAEHHYGTNGMCPSPNVMAAAVAARTSRAKLVLMGNCLPAHGHPVRVAEEIALLDNLSNGRMVAGFIRGGFLEHYAYSIDLAESRPRFEEAWRLILRAWTEDEPFEWHGPYYHYDAVSILPRPVQQPHPPLLMAGHTRESVEWAARERVPLAASFGATEVLARTFAYYREYAARECGWTPGPEHCLVSRQVYVAKTNAEARAEAEEHVLTFYRESPVIRPLEGKLAELRDANLTTRSASHYERQPGGEGAGVAGETPTRPRRPLGRRLRPRSRSSGSSGRGTASSAIRTT